MKKFIVGLMPLVLIIGGFRTSPFFVEDSWFWFFASMFMVVVGVVLLFCNVAYGLYHNLGEKLHNFLYGE